VYVTSPSTTPSFTPVTDTVCGVFQFAVVNVTLAGETVPSLVSLDVKPIVTSAVGWLVRTIVNVSVPPPSVVVRPLVGSTVIPAVSLSEIWTVTAKMEIPWYCGSLLAALWLIVPACVPSATASSTAVTVTVWATFQSAGVNVRLVGLTLS